MSDLRRIDPARELAAVEAWEDELDRLERDRELRRYWEQDDPARVVEARESFAVETTTKGAA